MINPVINHLVKYYIEKKVYKYTYTYTFIQIYTYTYTYTYISQHMHTEKKLDYCGIVLKIYIMLIYKKKKKITLKYNIYKK